MRTNFFRPLAGLAALAFCAGCSVNVGGDGGGGNPGTTLLSVTGRQILPGQVLAFPLNIPQAGRVVTVSVQADTDYADPNFEVHRGTVDPEDRNDTPRGDVVIISNGQEAGQEVDSFTPDTAGDYTLFVEDESNWPNASFSVTVIQF
jgi:hypothetical protein